MRRKLHAEWIAGRVETLLSHYFQPDTPQEVQEAAILDWVNLLWAFDEEDLDRACATYLRDQPRRRPTPGDIRSRAMTFRKERIEAISEERRKSLPPPPPEPVKPKITKEAAQRIIAEAGFTPDLQHALKRFPLSTSRQDATERASQPAKVQMTYETDPERLKKAREEARARGAV